MVLYQVLGVYPNKPLNINFLALETKFLTNH